MSSLRTLIPYLVGHRKNLGLGVLALVVADGFQLTSPWVFKFAIDGLEHDISREKLAMFAALLLGIALMGGVARYFMRRLVIGTSREIEYELRNTFFNHLTRLSYSYFNRTPTGDLMARATNDLNAVRAVLGPGLMYSVNTAITLGAAMVLMVILSWELTLISLIPLPMISIFMYRYGKLIHTRFESVQEQFSNITARAQEYLAGIRVVKAYVQEEAATRDFRDLNQEYLRRNMRLVRINAFFYPAIGFLAGLGSVLVLGFGGWLVIQNRITLGSFVAFNAYLIMLIWPMIALGWVISIFQRGAASMKRLNQVLDTVPEIADPEPAGIPNILSVPEGAATGELVFRNVRFAYASRPDEMVIDGINLHVEAGQTVAVVGRTGSGKTSLVNLIPRLYDPTEGAVFMDGKDLREIPLDTLRSRVGYVPQETFLFSRTVSRNIALGQPDATGEDIHRMAQLSRLADDVLGFPDRYETMVGERGVTLSGGQKQRAAIARALLRNPKILILDDALASVDTRTEEEILSGLREFMKNRTTLLVAHRISTVMLADRIVVLDEGRIVEEGTHAELLAEKGIYADIVRMQQLEEELEKAL